MTRFTESTRTQPEIVAARRAQGKAQFNGQVFPAELQEISDRRRTLGLPPVEHGPRTKPSVDLALTGLAISGGGIRSAAFSLGVLQSFAREGVLGRMDYLSTVSGGGYTGACLSSLMNDPGRRFDDDTFPLGGRPGTEEPPALSHLRNESDYLTSGGLLNKIRLPTLILRGIVLALFLFLPYIMAAVILTELVVAFEYEFELFRLRNVVFVGTGLFIVAALAYPYLARFIDKRISWYGRDRYERWLTALLVVTLVVALSIPMFQVVLMAVETPWEGPGGVQERIVEAVRWITRPARIGIGAALVVVLMAAFKTSESLSRATTRYLIMVFGLVGPAVIFGLYLYMTVVQTEPPFLDASLEREFQTLVISDDPTRALQDDAQALGRTLARHGYDIDTVLGVTLTRGESGEPRWTIRFTGEDPSVAARAWRRLTRVSDVRVRTLTVARVTTDGAVELRFDDAIQDLWDSDADLIFVGAFVLLWLVNRFLLDVNVASPHGFYRDRISHAFLIRLGEDGSLLDNDKQLLSDLNRHGTVAPYHIINTAINLGGSADTSLRGRNASFFIFTKRFVGCSRTGYVATEAMEAADRHLDLGTAMAISAAAATPNLGAELFKPLVFVTTLLNIRLGYWLPNPRRVRERDVIDRVGSMLAATVTWDRRALEGSADGKKRGRWNGYFLRGGARPGLLLKESIDMLDEEGSHVNLSDGAHIESLGIYELLRRRCRLIVAIDGESDPEMTFGSLVTLIRYARIDMGIEIDMNMDPLRPNAEGHSARHWVMGRIDYGEEQPGLLLYLKSSLTGDEHEYLRHYRKERAAFPHEPTADQFFNETQFEAYRSLGEHIATKTLDESVLQTMLTDPLVNA